MNELVLGIDTSTRVAVGLARDGQVLVSQLVGDTRSHVELAAVTVGDVLAQAAVRVGDLTCIGVGVGPGPFTGLRVGIATAQTIGQAIGVPVVGVCSLDIIALQHAGSHPGAWSRPEGEFVVASDARRHEIYWARYDRSGLRLDGPFVDPPSMLPGLPVVGPGVEAYPDLPGAVGDLPMDAGWLAANLDLLPDVGLEPLYLRQPDAEVASTRKSTLVSGRLRLPIGGPQ
ncbi:MAG: tRNA (adenosine(37)-N6)-threonylcarbamoyltransferase complex dimerization subunit type 1 TsaB [Propionibacteriaceae bacterium]|nr:tRNA (adenosine(37)-N6)-threonylcarbamoyltransferase complex dimerization subunit type 1 TsaB [Propionibacteriaceae bacterium]